MYEEQNKCIHNESVSINEHRETVRPDFQPAFDVLKSLNLDQYITEEERNFIGVH